VIQKIFPDQLRINVNRKISFPAIILTPEAFSQVRVVILLFIRLVLIEAIRHLEIVISCYLNLLL